MSFTMTMDLNKLQKLLAYLVVMCFFVAHPCCSYHDVQSPPLAPEPEAGAHSISHHQISTKSLYIHRLDVAVSAPSSPPSPPSDPSPPAPPRDISTPPPRPLLSDIKAQTPEAQSNFPPPTPPGPTPPPVESPPVETPSPVESPPVETPSPVESPPVETLSPVETPAPVEPLPGVPPSPVEPLSVEQSLTPTDKKNSGRVVVLAVSLFVIASILCFAGTFGWHLLKRRNFRKKNTEEESPRSEAPMIDVGANSASGGSISDGSDSDPASRGFGKKLPKRYPFHTLAKATSNFNEKTKLGEGGFGPVYKGTLNDGKNEVAVKRVSKKAKGAPKQYKTEVKILTKLSHRNLVELLGWCEEEGEFLLVYKFMPNGSLNSQLYSKSRLLTWGERYNIVLGLASALNYLHEECEECILHRDIKPDNVLLDSSFNAKLSDFGLARLVGHDLGSKNTTLAGTFGYLAPEHVQESIASKESDMYSFGVVLLEIACGRAPFVQNNNHPGEVTNLIDFVWDHYGRKEILKVADKRLNGEYSNEQMECVMIVGLWCAHPIYTERPTIGDAIRALKYNAFLPVLPPSKPHLLSLLSDIRLLSNIRSSTGNSSGTGLSRSSGSTTLSSHVSSSTSGSAALT